jgi:competence protein ComEA
LRCFMASRETTCALDAPSTRRRRVAVWRAFAITGVALFSLLVTVLPASSSSLGKEGEWTTLENCRLMRQETMDGDSFHVEHKGEEYIFRLYFVDAPETSMMIPSRVKEQAEVFGVAEERVLEAGHEAAKVALRHLNRPFTVHTQWQDAMGRSELPRSYAFIETADREDYGELLAAAGYARSFGVAAAPPGKQETRLRQRYDRLAEKAQRARIGAWGDRQGSGSVELEPADDVEATEDSAPGVTPPASAGDGAPDDLMAHALSASALGLPAGEESEETPASTPEATPAPTPEPTPEPAAAPEPKPGITNDGKVDLNHATLAELQTLPGIDATTAAAIIAARPFAGSFDLLRVPGVTPSTLKEIYPFVAE